jgi:hypothetical protein
MRILYIAVVILPMIALALWSGIIIVGLIRGECSKCPRCLTTWIRPSRRLRAGEKILPRFIRPYRCDNCRKRFFTCRSTDYTEEGLFNHGLLSLSIPPLFRHCCLGGR